MPEPASWQAPAASQLAASDPLAAASIVCPIAPSTDASPPSTGGAPPSVDEGRTQQRKPARQTFSPTAVPGQATPAPKHTPKPDAHKSTSLDAAVDDEPQPSRPVLARITAVDHRTIWRSCAPANARTFDAVEKTSIPSLIRLPLSRPRAARRSGASR